MTNVLDPIDIHESERTQAEAAETQRRRREADKEDIRRLMSEPWGRRFVWRQLEVAGVFRSSFTGASEGTIFHEGQRNVGLRLLGDIHEVCPEQYVRMLMECKGNA